MNILVVGSGGREHALAWKFKQSAEVKKFFCANGNAGISEIAACIDIKPDEIDKLADFAAANKIDLTFVGGEIPLSEGIVDEFEKRNLKIVGPNRKAARLESSKTFAKDFMVRHNIPTAKYKTADSVNEALKILKSGKLIDKNSPIVVKADGLAGGKGVVVTKNRKEAELAVAELENLAGREAIEKIIIEECLFGKEVSLLLFSDGKDFSLMPPVRDHKRIGDNDTGANTGGMGTFTDSSLLSEDETKNIIENIIKPTLRGAEKEGFPFRGILFVGLILTASGAKVLEYNVRFGDPETQAILVRLKTDLVEICDAICERNLSELKIEWERGSSACIVLAAQDYPAKARIGDFIEGLDQVKNNKNINIFHAGTARDENGNVITSGGRVLGVTTTAKKLNGALEIAYQTVRKISWNGMQYRSDIGK